MFALLFDLEVSSSTHIHSSSSQAYYLIPFVWFLTFCKLCVQDYATTYRATRDAYLKAANELKLATGPYKAARDAYVAATATYTKSLYE